MNNLGTLRNKIGDAHGQGGRPIKPGERHAALAVNLAGAVATFLVETFVDRDSGNSPLRTFRQQTEEFRTLSNPNRLSFIWKYLISQLTLSASRMS